MGSTLIVDVTTIHSSDN